MGLPTVHTDLPLIIVKGSPGDAHSSPVKNHCIKAKYRNSDLVKDSVLPAGESPSLQ